MGRITKKSRSLYDCQNARVSGDRIRCAAGVSLTRWSRDGSIPLSLMLSGKPLVFDRCQRCGPLFISNRDAGSSEHEPVSEDLSDVLSDVVKRMTPLPGAGSGFSRETVNALKKAPVKGVLYNHPVRGMVDERR